MFAVYLHQAFNLIRRELWTFRHYFIQTHNQRMSLVE